MNVHARVILGERFHFLFQTVDTVLRLNYQRLEPAMNLAPHPSAFATGASQRQRCNAHRFSGTARPGQYNNAVVSHVNFVVADKAKMLRNLMLDYIVCPPDFELWPEAPAKLLALLVDFGKLRPQLFGRQFRG